MIMEKRCVCCQEKFVPRNNLQEYCSKKVCQHHRKSNWQKKKLATDPSYRESQIDAVQLWRTKNPDYMKEYRKKHPQYTVRNRELQKLRRVKSAAPLLPPNTGVVKMDARTQKATLFPIMTGTYALTPASVVNMDAMVVQLTVLECVACP
jgi:hypothetical protein